MAKASGGSDGLNKRINVPDATIRAIEQGKEVSAYALRCGIDHAPDGRMCLTLSAEPNVWAWILIAMEKYGDMAEGLSDIMIREWGNLLDEIEDENAS